MRWHGCGDDVLHITPSLPAVVRRAGLGGMRAGQLALPHLGNTALMVKAWVSQHQVYEMEKLSLTLTGCSTHLGSSKDLSLVTGSRRAGPEGMKLRKLALLLYELL